MEKAAELAEGLLATSLWEGLPPAERTAAATAVRNGEYPFNAAEVSVLHDADGEELAEGGVEQFLTALAPAMQAAGVELRLATAEPADDSYAVLINGNRCLIAESRFEVSWLDATVKPLAHLNTLLARAGSPLRWHTLLAGGNDGWALLIEPSVADLMTRSGLFEPRDIPAEPPAGSADTSAEQAATPAASDPHPPAASDPSPPAASDAHAPAASDSRRGWFRRNGRK